MITLNNIKIGLLEDDSFFADVVKTFLERERGWEVKIYSATTEIKQETEMPDIFVFDYMMAVDDVSPTSKNVLKWMVAEYPEIPIIYFTSYKDMDTVIDLLKGGASDFLLKDENNLFELIVSIKDALNIRYLKEKAEDVDTKIVKLFSRFASVSGILLMLGLLLLLLTE